MNDIEQMRQEALDAREDVLPEPEGVEEEEEDGRDKCEPALDSEL